MDRKSYACIGKVSLYKNIDSCFLCQNGFPRTVLDSVNQEDTKSSINFEVESKYLLSLLISLI